MSFSDKLNQTNFFWELLKVTKDILVDHMKVALTSHEPLMEIGTPGEKYAKKIFYSLTDLNTQFDNLDLIPVFFSINEIPPYYLWNGISENQYYRYHLENHYSKINSIIQYAAALANEVYRLEIPVRECDVPAIINNQHTKDTDTAAILKEFELQFRQAKKIKNITVHAGKPEAEEINPEENAIITNGLIGNKKIFSDSYKTDRQAEISRITNKLEEDNNNVLKFITRFTDSLIHPFFHHYNFLQPDKNQQHENTFTG
jgi:hypothetical protein